MARRIVTAREQYEMLAPWRVAMPTYYHYTEDPDFEPDSSKYPLKADPDTPEGPGIFVAPKDEHGDFWSDYGDHRAEFYSPHDLANHPDVWTPMADGKRFPMEMFVPGHLMDDMEFKGTTPHQARRVAAMKQPWSDFSMDKPWPLQNSKTSDLIDMHDNLKRMIREGEEPRPGNGPHEERLQNHAAELLDRHEAGDPEATEWAERNSYIPPDYATDSTHPEYRPYNLGVWEEGRQQYPEDYPTDPRPKRRRKANSGNGGVDPNVNMRRQVTRADARAQEARQRGEHDLADYLEGLRDHMVGEADQGYPRPWSHYEPMAHEEFDIHTGAAPVICQNCGKSKDKHSKEHGNGKQHGTCPDNSGQWRPPPGHTPSQTTKSQEKQRAHSAAAHPQSHPDLHESFARHGSVHTTGGRVLSGWRLAAILAAFDDPAGWTFHTSFEPSQHALQGARAYSSLVGLPDPHDGTVDYLSARRSPDELRAAAQNYDSLPLHDAGAVPHFEAMRREMSQQHDFLVNRLGIKTQTVDHDPYSDVHEMLADINNNKRLKVMGTHVTGGHPYFSDDENDKFRAVHDFFGHAATGRSFDRHGEQAAYLAHAQMFSPHARPALASETKGQNSSLIFNGDFGPQKIATMDPVHWAHDLSNLGRTARRRMTEFDPDYVHVPGSGWDSGPLW